MKAKGNNIEKKQKNPDEFDFSKGFFFNSPFRCLKTEGVFSTVTLPAAGGKDLNGTFQQSIQQSFEQAKQAGIKQPLICGAIPFDVSQPSVLFIPKKVDYFTREQALSVLNAPAKMQIGKVAVKELPDKQGFTQAVSQAIATMQQGQLNKVVLSRLLELNCDHHIDHKALMACLISQNPSAYHFYLPLAQGALMGASPELLLRKSADKFFSYPLAGSARRAADSSQDAEVAKRLQQSAKDLHEHHIVTQGMHELLFERCRYLNIPASPELLSTSTLWHLATPIEGEVKAQEENALSLACLLHPTPALCGAPKALAFDVIKQLEPFDRGLFGGVVGWCDANGDGEWVVVIRSSIVRDNQVQLFAGAGIVPNSNPESEWEETGVKLSTLLRAFGLH